MRELFQGGHPDHAVLAADRLALEVLCQGHERSQVGDFDQALLLYRSAAEQASADAVVQAEVAAALADCHANLGEIETALVWADRAIVLLGDTTNTRQQLAARERRAFYLAWMGRADTAALESESVVTALRELAREDSRLLADLARSLDHRAEILERGQRLREAQEAAAESTTLRRKQDLDSPIALLRSLVTLARLTAALGECEQALALCEECKKLSDDAEGGSSDMPLDLHAQIVTLHGRVLMELGQHGEGEAKLRAGARLFRRLAREGEGSAVFRDALAEVLLDLGRLHFTAEPNTARACMARAVAWKRRIEREHPHPFHRAGLAEALICLGRAESACNAPVVALRHFDLAVDLLSELVLPASGYASMATRLSFELLALARRGIGSTQEHIQRFRQLASLFVQAGELVDDSLLDMLLAEQRAFQSLWLTWFIDAGAGGGVLSLLTFAHGQRLARLARAEQLCHTWPAGQPDDSDFFQLRRDLYRLDLEMAEILSARSPSLIQPLQGRDDRRQLKAMDNAIAGAGRTLEEARRHLYQRYLVHRDQLMASGQYPKVRCAAIHISDLAVSADTVLAVICVPRAMAVDRDVLLILVLPGEIEPQVISVPEVSLAHHALGRLLSAWGQGRSGRRGRATPAAQCMPVQHDDEPALWRNMSRLWRHMAVPGIRRIDLITHAEAHNLPWLGSCPVELELRQFPSLHYYSRRLDAPPVPMPSPEHPLVLALEPSGEEIGDTLYFTRLEAEAIRLIWRDAVRDTRELGSDPRQNASALWIIGHGLSERGQPWFGRGETRRPLNTLSSLARLDVRIGLVYASTCYLGQTTDVEGEPVGLPGLAALRHEMPLTSGAVAPVDDLGAARLARLFHVFWKRSGDVRQAFRRVRIVAQSGEWPEEVLHVLQMAGRSVLPAIKAQAQAHAAMGSEEMALGHPQLSPRQRLELQYTVRKQARNCLVDIAEIEATSPSPNLCVRVSTTARLWALLG